MGSNDRHEPLEPAATLHARRSQLEHASVGTRRPPTAAARSKVRAPRCTRLPSVVEFSPAGSPRCEVA